MKHILITGATGYFGRYFVNGLRDDFKIIAMGRNEAKLKECFPDDDVILSIADLYDTKALEKELKRLFETYEIHGLINNAYDFSKKTGFNVPDSKPEDLGLDEMRAAFESGLLAPTLVAQAVGKQMIQKKIQGSIVNISSMYGMVAPDYRLYEGKTVFNPMTYGIVKSGINGLTRYLASFWGPYGIRCNSISPGAMPNTETDSVNAPKDTEFLGRLEDKTTLGRVGHPKDLIGMTKLLLSDDSSYVTGQVIGVDGGWATI